MKLLDHQTWEKMLPPFRAFSTSMWPEKTAYSQLPASASDTESLLENGSDSSQKRPSPSSSRSWTFRGTTILLFFLMNLAFFVVIWFRPSGRRPYDASDRLFPRAEYETLLFRDDHIAPGPDTDLMWKEGLPRGHGFTIIDSPDKYGLPQGVAYDNGFNQYGVSWAHQYHCVWMLREAFFDLVQNKSMLVGIDMNEKSKEGEKLWHLAHCFGYLRQHILCNMDMTLEWPTLGGENAGIINGYDIPHQCVQRGPFDEYMDAHGPDAKKLVKVKKPNSPTHQELIDGATTRRV